jgi:predicted chitinase
MLTEAQLQAILPHCKHLSYLPLLSAAMNEAGINTPLRIAAFLAQIAHESYEFRYMGEVWGPTEQQLKYERPVVNGVPAPLVTPGHGVKVPLWQQLGNTEHGDGYKFRGAGPIQLTGRNNYREYGHDLGLDLEAHPEQAQTPAVGFRLAGRYWVKHGLNELADAKNFDEITHRINGGYNGKPQRDAYYAKALSVLTSAS